MESVSELYRCRPQKRQKLLWQTIRSLWKFFLLGGQRLFQFLFSLAGLCIGLLGFGRPTAKQSALIMIGVLLFTLSPSLNLPGATNMAYAEISIDDPFLNLEEGFMQKPFVSGNHGPTDTIITYEVQPGDTVSEIASRFGITMNTVLWVNDFENANMVRPGMKLKILPVSGLLYKVANGDTIGSIAKKNNIGQDIIIYQNNLDPNSALAKGSELILPGAEKKLARPNRNVYISTERGRSLSQNPGYGTIYGGGALLIPTAGNLTQGFRRGHYGIDIANRSLSSIHAAESGKIIKAKYSGWNGGYGHHVIIDHGNGIQTLYAHLSDVYVQPGQMIDRGEAIARMGNTGRSSGPHLHFEVINQGRKSNPWNYLERGVTLTSR